MNFIVTTNLFSSIINSIYHIDNDFENLEQLDSWLSHNKYISSFFDVLTCGYD